MMYILHWILLDALWECVPDSKTFQNESLPILNYLLSLDDIRLLVYAIVPLLHTLRESNFNGPRLEAGLKYDGKLATKIQFSIHFVFFSSY